MTTIALSKDGYHQVGLDENSSLMTTFLVVTRIEGYPLVLTQLPKNLNANCIKIFGLSGVAVIRDDKLLMGYGENEEEANQNHDENLVRLLHKALKTNLRRNSSKMNLLNLTGQKSDLWVT